MSEKLLENSVLDLDSIGQNLPFLKNKIFSTVLYLIDRVNSTHLHVYKV